MDHLRTLYQPRMQERAVRALCRQAARRIVMLQNTIVPRMGRGGLSLLERGHASLRQEEGLPAVE